MFQPLLWAERLAAARVTIPRGVVATLERLQGHASSARDRDQYRNYPPGRHQDLFDVGAEALAIDRAVEDPRCGQPRDPQRGEKRAGLPAPAGGVVVDARATRCPAVPPKQIGGAAGFVQTHEVGDIPGRRRRVPRDPRGRDVRPIVFGRADRFF